MSETKTNVDRARELLRTAAEASKALEESVRELVTMRAWDVLGYANFSEMWKQENGFKVPVAVQACAVDALRLEGFNTSAGRGKPNGHTRRDMEGMLGLHGTVMSNMALQLQHGVPAMDVSCSNHRSKTVERIANFGSSTPIRRRATSRRIGAAHDELVTEGFSIIKRDADQINEIARQANLPKSEIYRQAVAEYLARHRESRPKSDEPLDLAAVTS